MDIKMTANKLFAILELEDMDAPINDKKREAVKDLLQKIYNVGRMMGSDKALGDAIQALQKMIDQ